MVRAQDPRWQSASWTASAREFRRWKNGPIISPRFGPMVVQPTKSSYVSVAGPCGGAKCHEKMSPMEIVFLMSLQALRHIQTLHTRLVNHRNRPPGVWSAPAGRSLNTRNGLPRQSTCHRSMGFLRGVALMPRETGESGSGQSQTGHVRDSRCGQLKTSVTCAIASVSGARSGSPQFLPLSSPSLSS